MWETKKELRKEAELAEERAVIHFRKVNQIEMILKNAEKKDLKLTEYIREKLFNK